jgi:hypothetical protein
MSTSELMKVTEGIVDLLNPLTCEERRRAVQAAFALLGEGSPPLSNAPAGDAAISVSGDAHPTASAKAQIWVKQNAISIQALDQVFHIEEGKATFIAGEMPGKSDREKTINAYIVAGLASLIASGELRFTDKQARDLCISVGCYDKNNHGTYLKAKGNNFAGTKDKGWTLTAPGLKASAKIVTDLTKATE